MMCFVNIDSEGVVTSSWTSSVKMTESQHVSMTTSSQDAAAAAGWYHIEYIYDIIKGYLNPEKSFKMNIYVK